MTREAALAVMIGVAVLVLAALAFAWLRRARRDAALVAPIGDVPAGAAELSRWAGLYVATTAHEQPLERLAVRGLGFRSRAVLTVTDRGIGLEMPGSPALFIPAAQLVAADQSTVVIDRVVERDGLLRLVWRIDAERVVDSYLRPQEASARAVAESIRPLIPSGSDA